MKRLWAITLWVLALNPLMGQTAVTPATRAFQQLSWLEGTWHQTTRKAGQSAYERWTWRSPNEFRGIGVSMQGPDTLFVEKLRILEQNDTLYYVADVPENRTPVYFKLTAISEYGFTAENPSHDFPQRIEYRRIGNTLRATISAGEKSIIFTFHKP